MSQQGQMLECSPTDTAGSRLAPTTGSRLRRCKMCKGKTWVNVAKTKRGNARWQPCDCHPLYGANAKAELTAPSRL